MHLSQGHSLDELLFTEPPLDNASVQLPISVHQENSLLELSNHLIPFSENTDLVDAKSDSWLWLGFVLGRLAMFAALLTMPGTCRATYSSVIEG